MLETHWHDHVCVCVCVWRLEGRRRGGCSRHEYGGGGVRAVEAKRWCVYSLSVGVYRSQALISLPVTSRHNTLSDVRCTGPWCLSCLSSSNAHGFIREGLLLLTLALTMEPLPWRIWRRSVRDVVPTTIILGVKRRGWSLEVPADLAAADQRKSRTVFKETELADVSWWWWVRAGEVIVTLLNKTSFCLKLNFLQHLFDSFEIG